MPLAGFASASATRRGYILMNVRAGAWIFKEERFPMRGRKCWWKTYKTSGIARRSAVLYDPRLIAAKSEHAARSC
jgi:hypothetical protein